MDIRDKVTILIYAWGDPFHSRIDKAEKVITHTRKMIGDCHAVIVSNHSFLPTIPDIEVQVSEDLIAGDINSMSYDCIVNLWKRFDTEYVLIVQEDGYPIRKGIEEFIGKSDYLGASMIRNSRQWLASLLRIQPMNGGFSLRSKKICKKASESYKWLRWFAKPKTWWFSEDVYYTITAMVLPWYRFGLKLPSLKIVDLFAWDCLGCHKNFIHNKPSDVPFGVHGWIPYEEKYRISFTK